MLLVEDRFRDFINGEIADASTTTEAAAARARHSLRLRGPIIGRTIRVFALPARVVRVAKVWVLDTETKGTGAQMVPLEKVLRQPAAEPEPLRARPLPKPRPKPKAPEPVPPRRFRVIDALSRQVLADDADAPATLGLLRGIARPVDVSIYVWEPKPEQWRLLTNREKKMLWGFRERRGAAGRSEAETPDPTGQDPAP